MCVCLSVCLCLCACVCVRVCQFMYAACILKLRAALYFYINMNLISRVHKKWDYFILGQV